MLHYSLRKRSLNVIRRDRNIDSRNIRYVKINFLLLVKIKIYLQRFIYGKDVNR